MIEYHADDYGLFKTQSRHIMECYHSGALNGISIMPNSPYLRECMEEIQGIREKLFVTVHLNFVEGKPLTGKKCTRLTDKNGNFGVGFGKYLLIGFVPVLRKLYYRELYREIEAQLHACEKYMNEGKFRIDGHVHFHMLPLVFDALMEVIKNDHLEVSYIRFPKEELEIYRKAKGVRDIKPINIIKVLVLNALCRRNIRKYNETLRDLGLEEKLFMGVMLSGHMFYDNLKALIPIAADIMPDRGLSDMEILFHPGDVTESEDAAKLTSRDDIDFLCTNASNRAKEAEALKRFGKETI
ncbi:MAG: ChbG/HpnK family deacetylase [Butyrivibrio sp.]|nr:ChbG/HpnK family deacetylase [Butyrivibrio sp.]